jgi:hypothetical protein
MRTVRSCLAVPLAALCLVACSKVEGEVPATEVRAAAEREPVPQIVVHKSPTCGCCEKWVDHLRAEGFVASVVDTDDLGSFKQSLAVPREHSSCHTAVVGGYFIEGHVPAADIRRLLAQRPAARGLAVPGMPLGSPGMEVPSGQVDRYETLLIDASGNASVFSRHGPP